VLRLFVLLVVCATAFVWVEPRWSESERTLALRLRTAGEILDIVRAESRDLGRRAAEEIGERLRTPEVASPPPPPPVSAPAPAEEAIASEPEARAEEISRADRERLDRLIEEKLREE
jgi:hypothetical protein